MASDRLASLAGWIDAARKDLLTHADRCKLVGAKSRGLAVEIWITEALLSSVEMEAVWRSCKKNRLSPVALVECLREACLANECELTRKRPSVEVKHLRAVDSALRKLRHVISLALQDNVLKHGVVGAAADPAPVLYAWSSLDPRKVGATRRIELLSVLETYAHVLEKERQAQAHPRAHQRTARTTVDPSMVGFIRHMNRLPTLPLSADAMAAIARALYGSPVTLFDRDAVRSTTRPSKRAANPNKYGAKKKI